MFRKLLNFLRRSKIDAEIQEELEFHRNQTAGSFGNITAIREQTRDASTIVWVESLLQDIRIALRLLRRAPSLTLIALLSAALSVGATAVVFTAVKAVLLKPLPYYRPSELIQLGTRFANAGPSHIDWVFWNDTQEIIRRTRTLQSVGVYSNAVFDLRGGFNPPEALYGLRISASLFPTLGVSPMLGRNILPEEDEFGRPNELILSYGLWKRRFNSDRNIVGKDVNIDGHDCRVIGVMPSGFDFPLRRGAAHTPEPYVEFWAPMKAGRVRELDREKPGHESAVGAVGRLRSGVSLAEAQQDLASIGRALAREFPATNRDRTLRAGLLRDRTLGSMRPTLWFLMVAASLFLLIGCANIANLLLARSMAREREISIRIAIGAGKRRIVRQLLTESCVLGLLGGLAGYALTTASWKVLPSLAPVSIPRLATAHVDWTILVFALAVALASGLLFGLAPALRSSRSTTPTALRDLGVRGAASGRNDRTRAALVITEVGITVALVLIGSQLLASFISLLRTDPGFQADRLVASVVLPEPERYKTDEQRSGIYRRFVEAVRAIPGVTNVGTVDALPFSGENHGGFVSASRAVPTDPKNQSVAEINIVGAEYLQTLGVHLAAGRWFREDDMKDASDATIINDSAAQQLWPGENAIGKQLCVNCTPENPNNWKRVIGVVSSVRHADLDAPPGFNVYLSARAYANAAFLIVRTERPLGEVSKAIQRAIASVDPDQPVLLTTSMESLLADSIADRRFIVSLLVVTGCLALLMALAGIYGVTLYTTSRRTQEIGVRMALGATPARIHALLFRQGFQTVFAGLVIGLISALIVMRTLRGVISGLGTGSITPVWIAGGLVLFTAALACWVPAHRVTTSDPMSALRQD
jgi:putative ABC transport system permease protein